MTNRLLLEAIGEIDEKFVCEAMPRRFKPKKQKYLRYAAIAACFFIIIAVPYYQIVLKGASSEGSPPDNAIDKIKVIDFGNSYYEIVEDAVMLERIGLTSEITPDMLSNRIGYLEETVPGFEFIESTAETNFELFEYAKAPFESVYILRNGENLNFAVFCNYHVPQNSALDITDAFAVNGVESPEDIEAYWKTDNDYNRISSEITDLAAVEAFYTEIIALPKYSFDEFHNEAFGPDFSDDEYVTFANSEQYRLSFRAHRLNFTFDVYAESGWIYSRQTLTYYKISDSLAEMLNSF